MGSFERWKSHYIVLVYSWERERERERHEMKIFRWNWINNTLIMHVLFIDSWWPFNQNAHTHIFMVPQSLKLSIDMIECSSVLNWNIRETKCVLCHCQPHPPGDGDGDGNGSTHKCYLCASSVNIPNSILDNYLNAGLYLNPVIIELYACCACLLINAKPFVCQ